MKPASAKAKSYLRPLNKYRQANTVKEYLDQRYEVNGECHVWTGAKDKDGYGQVQNTRASKELGVRRAHRMSYIDNYGPIPQGMWVLHKCDNPSCIRKEHLFLGTPLDNVTDMIKKGRRVLPNKRRIDYAEILNSYGKMSCIEAATKFNISYSRVCQIWRENGKRDKRRS